MTITDPRLVLVPLCEWKEDSLGRWMPGCNVRMLGGEFIGPQNEGFIWCPYCARPIKEVPNHEKKKYLFRRRTCCY